MKPGKFGPVGVPVQVESSEDLMRAFEFHEQRAGTRERINLVLNIGETVTVLPTALMFCPECKTGDLVYPGEWEPCMCGKTQHVIC